MDNAEFMPVICREAGKPFDDVFQMVFKRIMPPQLVPPAYIHHNPPAFNVAVYLLWGYWRNGLGG